MNEDAEYLAAWAHTRREQDDSDITSGTIVISRVIPGSYLAPEVCRRIEGNIGDQDFDQDAADAMLTGSGYRRIGPWIEGSADALQPGSPGYAPAMGRSCRVEQAQSLA